MVSGRGTKILDLSFQEKVCLVELVSLPKEGGESGVH